MLKTVIIGNGIAGASACETLLAAGKTEIAIISKSEYPAYDKNKLTAYLSADINEKGAFIFPEDYYEKNNINLFKDSEVVRLDTKRQRVILKNNTKIDYAFLMIASGCSTDIPDIPGKAKEGVFGLDSLEDAKTVRERLLISENICLITESYYPEALVELLLAKNKEVKIVARQILEPFTVKERLELLSGITPQELIGEGELQAVKLSNGKVIAADLALFLGPHRPNTNFLKDTDIRTENGYILANSLMQTSREEVFACGSACASEGGIRPDKTWETAKQEGILAAQGLLKTIERGNALCQKS